MAGQPELLVETGIQAGLGAGLQPGASMVGSAIDCTIVIADPQLQPHHFELLVGARAVRLRAVQGALILHDGNRIEPGQEVLCRDLCGFTAGGTGFTLTAAGMLPGAGAGQSQADADAYAEDDLPALYAHRRSGRMQGRLISFPVLSGMAAMVVAGLLVFTGVGLRAGRATPTRMAAIIAPAAPASGDALHALRARLDAAGLGAVSISPTPDGSIVARGMLFPAQRVAWDAVRKWCDAKYGSDVVLVDQVATAGSVPPIVVAAVWAGASPYMVDGNGDRLVPGSSVGNGWVLDQIQPGRLVIRNGQQRVAVRY